MKIEIKTEGGAEARLALKARGRAAEEAVRLATGDALALVAREVKALLSLRQHPAGTPTPAPPGAPPARVTGQMAHRVRAGLVRRVRPYVWTGDVGSDVPQARIQELGGWTGRNHASYLPPRPYIKPATRAAHSKIRNVYKTRLREAMKV